MLYKQISDESVLRYAGKLIALTFIHRIGSMDNK